jgi:hypothetical protein
MTKEDKDRIRRSVLAVLEVANSNFPAPTYVTISADGKNTASVTLADYELRALLEK